MKAIIEQFEPDVHQFLAVDVVGKNGDLFAKYYFSLFATGWTASIVKPCLTNSSAADGTARDR